MAREQSMQPPDPANPARADPFESVLGRAPRVSAANRRERRLQAAPVPRALEIALRLEAVAESIAEARAAIRALCELHAIGQPRSDDVQLAVSEAVTNVVLHAYLDAPAGAERVCELEAWLERGRLCVTVRDFGRGFIPRPDSPGLGLGLKIVGALATQLRTHGAPGQHLNEISMEFAYPE